jgi:hypothetical protein
MVGDYNTRGHSVCLLNARIIEFLASDLDLNPLPRQSLRSYSMPCNYYLHRHQLSKQICRLQRPKMKIHAPMHVASRKKLTIEKFSCGCEILSNWDTAFVHGHNVFIPSLELREKSIGW